MDIYFSGAIRGGRDDVKIYKTIIDIISEYGHVFTAYIGDENLDPISGEGESDEFIWERDVNWIKDSDVVIAEVSQPSHGVGYEISAAHQLNIPVLALSKYKAGKRISAMVCGDPNVTCMYYDNLLNLEKILRDYFRNQ